MAQLDYTQKLLNSGHYQVRPSSGKDLKRFRAPASEQSSVVLVPQEKNKNQPVVISTENISSKAAAPSGLLVEQNNFEVPTIGDQLRSLYSEEDLKILEFYEKQLSEQDPRRNKLDVLFAPGWSYVDSVSDYSPRKYRTAFPQMLVQSNVWLTPGIGLSGQFSFSMGASIPGDMSLGTRDLVRFENIEIGFRTRFFDGFDFRGSSREFSVFYLEDSTYVSTDSARHPRLRSTGFGVGVTSRHPDQKGSGAFIFGGSFLPRMGHVEQGTHWKGRSGSSLENIRLSIEIGREEILNRKSQIYYGIKATSERDSFDGPASAVDPVTSITPTNVSVTNSATSFFFGYRWGH